MSECCFWDGIIIYHVPLDFSVFSLFQISTIISDDFTEYLIIYINLL